MTSPFPHPELVAADLVETGPPSELARSEGLASMEVLHSLYGHRIFRFLLVSLRDRDVAQTLTQDTFMRAWTARESFRGDCSPVTWLTRIALNLVRDHTRTNRFKFWKRAAQTAVDVQDIATHIPDSTASAESTLSARQQLTLVWETVETLSERQRNVFVLRFVEELELSEIAEITGLPISTVKTHLYRSLAAIRSRHLASPKPGRAAQPKESR